MMFTLISVVLATAQAGPPAPSLQLTTVGSTPETADGGGDHAAEATRHLLDAIRHRPDRSGWFQLADWSQAPSFAERCSAADTEAQACIRRLFADTPARSDDQRARVVVLYRSLGADAVGWTCIGVGAASLRPHDQEQVFSTTGWDDADVFWEIRLRAVNCVMAAAAESGW